MTHEIAVAGLMFPSLLACAAVAVIVWIVLDRVLVRLDLWRVFWRPPLARAAALVALIAAVALLAPNP